MLLLLLLLLQPAFVATSSSHLKVGLDWKVKFSLKGGKNYLKNGFTFQSSLA